MKTKEARSAGRHRASAGAASGGKSGLLLGAALSAAAAGGIFLLLRQRGVGRSRSCRETGVRPQQETAARRRVVILGAGFAGMAAVEALAASDHRRLDVTLVDRRNYHLFTPLLYHISSGLTAPMHITYPVRSVTAKHGFRFRESVVQAIDLEGRRVVTDEGDLPYDDLILALGATTHYFGLTEVQEHSFPLKTIGGAVAVRNQVIDAFEAADVEDDPERRRELLTFAIVGGGPTGVELAGGLYGLMHDVLLRHYPTLRPEEVTIVVVEAMGQLLPGWDPFFVEASRRALQRKGIVVRLNSPVIRITPEYVELQDGERIRTRTAVWTAGVRPVGVVADLSVPKVRGGRLRVNEYLELPDYPGVFAIGDAAGFLDPGSEQPVPGLAAIAEPQGRTVARNILRRERGEAMRPFRYQLIGQSLSLGRHEGLVDVRGWKLQGFTGWLAWRAIHLIKLRGWRNRFGVVLDWIFSYILLRDTLRLEVEP